MTTAAAMRDPELSAEERERLRQSPAHPALVKGVRRFDSRRRVLDARAWFAKMHAVVDGGAR